MKFVKIVALGAVLAAGAVYAQDVEPTDPNVIARQDLMKVIGKNIGIIADMAGGKAAFDATAAEAAKAALIEAAAGIEAAFMEPGGADPASESRPEIWTNWEDFLAKATKLGEAATALDVASAATLGAGMGAVGGACKDCHTTYRVMK